MNVVSESVEWPFQVAPPKQGEAVNIVVDLPAEDRDRVTRSLLRKLGCDSTGKESTPSYKYAWKLTDCHIHVDILKDWSSLSELYSRCPEYCVSFNIDIVVEQPVYVQDLLTSYCGDKFTDHLQAFTVLEVTPTIARARCTFGHPSSMELWARSHLHPEGLEFLNQTCRQECRCLVQPVWPEDAVIISRVICSGDDFQHKLLKLRQVHPWDYVVSNVMDKQVKRPARNRNPQRPDVDLCVSVGTLLASGLYYIQDAHEVLLSIQQGKLDPAKPLRCGLFAIHIAAGSDSCKDLLVALMDTYGQDPNVFSLLPFKYHKTIKNVPTDMFDKPCTFVTPLHIAARSGSFQCLWELLRRKGRVDLLDVPFQQPPSRATAPEEDAKASSPACVRTIDKFKHGKERHKFYLSKQLTLNCLYAVTSVEYYEMWKKPRGLALVVNVGSFCEASGLRSRNPGSQEDVDRLVSAFGEKLYFKVDVMRDPTAREMDEKIKAIANDSTHEQYDCFVCVLMSHGRLGELYGSDGQTVNVEFLVGQIANSTFLMNKPKLFFIQACRGQMVFLNRSLPHQSLHTKQPSSHLNTSLAATAGSLAGGSVAAVMGLGAVSIIGLSAIGAFTACYMWQRHDMGIGAFARPVGSVLSKVGLMIADSSGLYSSESDFQGSLASQSKGKAVITDEDIADALHDAESLAGIALAPDCLVGYATLPNYVCYRCDEGSVYITSLIQVLEENADNEDVTSMIIRTTQVVSDKLKDDLDDGRLQLPDPIIRLTKKLFFV